MSEAPKDEVIEHEEEQPKAPVIEAAESKSESNELTCDALNALGSVSSDVVLGVSSVGVETLSGVSAAINAIYQPLTNMFNWNNSVGALPLRKLGNQGLMVPPQGVCV